MAKYKKKPVIIEAYQYDGDFIGQNGWYAPDWIKQAYENGVLFYREIDNTTPELFISTLEGFMKCNVGDYIIKGVKGELYPCKPDFFEKTYELIKN